MRYQPNVQEYLQSISRSARHAFTLFLAGSVGFMGTASAQTNPPPCPTMGWAEGLVNNFMQPTSPFPTQDTANLNAPDCAFHQWSWEAFAWAITLVKDAGSGTQVPRFLTLRTPDELLPAPGAPPKKAGPRTLVLGVARSLLTAPLATRRTLVPSSRPTAT